MRRLVTCVVAAAAIAGIARWLVSVTPPGASSRLVLAAEADTSVSEADPEKPDAVPNILAVGIGRAGKVGYGGGVA